MIALNGYFDGKVIVPDSLLNLATNQRVRVQIEPIPTVRVNFKEWIGKGLEHPTNPSPRFSSRSDV